MNRLALAAAALAVAPLVSGATHRANAQAAFDGTWSVTIITEKGTCDKAYNYPLSVRNGTVGYDGKGDFDVRGRVNPNGFVQVRISLGSQSAEGSGRLAMKSGSGTWAAGDQSCSGRWRASRKA